MLSRAAKSKKLPGVRPLGVLSHLIDELWSYVQVSIYALGYEEELIVRFMEHLSALRHTVTQGGIC